MTTNELTTAADLLDTPDFEDVVREIMIAEGLTYSRALIVAAVWWSELDAARPATRAPMPILEVAHDA